MNKAKLREEAKKNLPDYNEKEVEAFVHGAEYGDEHHKENHQRPKEWYEERDRRRAEAAPRISAFVDGVQEHVRKGMQSAIDELVDKTRERTIEVLSHEMCDTDSEAGNHLFSMLVEGRRLDVEAKHEDFAERIIKEDIQRLMEDVLQFGLADDLDATYDWIVKTMEGLKRVGGIAIEKGDE